MLGRLARLTAAAAYSWGDMLVTIRALRRRPGFVTVIALTLALGVGANTAVFSVVYTVLLAPLPFPEPDRLVTLTEVASTMNTNLVSPVTFADWEERNTVFSDIAAFRYFENVTVEGPAPDSPPEPVLHITVTPNFFRVLGLRPLLGRPLTDDKTADGGVEAVLSYELWMRRFGGDRNAIGKTIRVRGASALVVGVMPPVSPALSIGWGDLWTPLRRYNLQELRASSYRARYLSVVARLKPNVTLAQTRGRMTDLQHQLQQEATSVASGYEVRVESLEETLVSPARAPLLIVLGAAAFVLLAACANVANLMLARAASREREVAVRVALGAPKSRLVQALLAESFVLSVLGGALGLVVARGGLALIASVRPDIPRLSTVGLAGGLHVPALLFTLGVTIAATLFFSVAPAVGLDQLKAYDALKEAGRTGAGGIRRHRLRRVLVASQVTFACVLLIAAGLLVSSLAKLLRVDPGFRPDGAAIVDLNHQGLWTVSDKQRAIFYRDLMRRLSERPGISAAGALLYFPYHPKLWQSTVLAEGQPVRRGEELIVYYNLFAGDYFRAMGIPLVSGRYPTPREMWEENLGVALINEAMARTLFPGVDPLGRRFRTGEDERWSTVIGVVGDIRQRRLDETPHAEYYLPISTMPMPWMTVVTRTGDGAGTRALSEAALLRTVRTVVHEANPNLATPGLMPLRQFVDGTITSRRVAMTLVLAFACLTLGLAGVGIYGVMAYTVGERTSEIGVRLALGATSANIVGLIAREGAVIALGGAAVGVVLALGLGRALSALLFNATWADGSIYLIAPVVVVLVALVASYIPARRAARVRPIVALRGD